MQDGLQHLALAVRDKELLIGLRGPSFAYKAALQRIDPDTDEPEDLEEGATQCGVQPAALVRDPAPRHTPSAVPAAAADEARSVPKDKAPDFKHASADLHAGLAKAAPATQHFISGSCCGGGSLWL